MFNRQSPAALAEQIAKRSHDSPEFWLFNPPASPKEIKRLETRLGRKLPEHLSHALAKINGGFVSPEGKVCIDSPEEVSSARDKANRFLSCGEIDRAYRSLLTSHPAEDPADFPFIPFMKLADGGFLAINADDPMATVWNAWTLEGPHLWGRLYPSFADLLCDYIGREGAILSQCFDDEPTALPVAYP
jgi:hypothetical protein